MSTQPKTPHAAVFFDRDGTLTHDSGYTYLPNALRWKPGAIEAIRSVNNAGVLAIVVTNQSGIARGYFTEDDMHRFHARMTEELRANGAHIDAFYFCPHHGDGVIPEFAHADHPDRKPNPGMLRRALIEWSLDRDACFLIGDSEVDLAAGKAAGLRSYLVTQGELKTTVERGLRLIATERRDDSGVDLLQCASDARAWLFEHALPLWWERGFDRRARCFHERLTLQGVPVIMERRIRVQARQTFVYASGGRLGWGGPWREAVESGLDVLLNRGIRTDGGTRHALNSAGQPSDERRDLYDLAFVVLALATSASALGGHDDAIEAAQELVSWAETRWAHPNGGFYEGDISPVPPRRQNPHMHFFEALLALYEVTADTTLLHRADRIAALIADCCIDRRSGALPECFDASWRPLPVAAGRAIEPGHQFEWYWLFMWFKRLGGRDLSQIAQRMRVYGEVYGVASTGGAVCDELFLDGRILDHAGRLWPHAERIKANLASYECHGDRQALNTLHDAFNELMQFCGTPTRGLWYERRSPTGVFICDDAPASSLYHIVSAMAELIRVTESNNAARRSTPSE